MISFAAITPHPPVIIPGIGREEDLKAVEKTIDGMKKLRGYLESANPHSILIISPHAEMEADCFVINSEIPLRGNFVDFGLDRAFDFANNLELAGKIVSHAARNDIPVHLHGSLLDHGALVPLYYLAKNIQPKIIHCSFSFFDFKAHYQYGKIMGEVLKKGKEKIAVVASGDLSHRLTAEAPAGYSPKGKIFDEKLIQLLTGKKAEEILHFDKGLAEEAGECGLRSITMLLGILENEEYDFDLVNYEGPFGVGYLTARFEL